MASAPTLLTSLAAIAALLSSERALPASPAAAEALVVSATGGLATALTDIARRYNKGEAGWINFTFGPSSDLARKIAAGSDADLFISDDEASMRALDAAEKLEPGTRVSLLSNQLAIIVPADRAQQLTTGADLKAPGFRKIAIGDPAAEPAGVYARRYLEVVGVWADLIPRLMLMGTLKDALAAVEAGKVDAAIVYRTDVRGSTKAAVALTIPRDRTPGIVYQAAVMKDAKSKDAARAFLNFLRDRDARTVFQLEGFITLVAAQLRAPSAR
jgi:molybdate transport system substrate-binding protein